MVPVVAKQLVTTISDAVKDAPRFLLAAYLLLSLFVLTQIVRRPILCESARSETYTYSSIFSSMQSPRLPGTSYDPRSPTST